MGMMQLKEALSLCTGQAITSELANAIMEFCAEPEATPVFLADMDFPAKKYQGYEIKATKLAYCLPRLQELHQQQWDEIEENRPPLNVDYFRYVDAEKSGKFVQIGIFHNEEFVGGCGFFLYPSIQTQILVAEETAMYLLPEHRTGLLAFVMMRYCKDFLQKAGVKEVFLTVKYYANTGKMIERLGFRKTDTVYLLGMGG